MNRKAFAARIGPGVLEHQLVRAAKGNLVVKMLKHLRRCMGARPVMKARVNRFAGGGAANRTSAAARHASFLSDATISTIKATSHCAERAPRDVPDRPR